MLPFSKDLDLGNSFTDSLCWCFGETETKYFCNYKRLDDTFIWIEWWRLQEGESRNATTLIPTTTHPFILFYFIYLSGFILFYLLVIIRPLPTATLFYLFISMLLKYLLNHPKLKYNIPHSCEWNCNKFSNWIPCRRWSPHAKESS